MTYRVDTLSCVAFDHGEVDCPPEGERYGCVDCRWSRAYDSGRERMKRTVAVAARTRPAASDPTAGGTASEGRECLHCALECGQPATHTQPLALCEEHFRSWSGSHEAARARASMMDWLHRARAEAANS